MTKTTKFCLGLMNLLFIFSLAQGQNANDSTSLNNPYQEVNPTTSPTIKPRICRHIFTVGGGQLQYFNTRNSPLLYQGPDFAIMYQAIKENTDRIAMDWGMKLDIGMLFNPAQNQTSFGFDNNIHFGAYYKTHPINNLSLYFGGVIKSETGIVNFAYSTGNNAMSTIANTNLNAGFMARYRFHIKRLNLEFNYSLNLPLIGRNLAPDHDVSYFELSEKAAKLKDFMGTTYLGNFQGLDQNISLDFVLRKSQIRLSYVGHSYWSNQKGNQSELHSNTFLIGYVLDLDNQTGSHQPKKVKKHKSKA